MTTLLFVRHGITAENLNYTLIGRTDVPLHPCGVLQARAVAKSLKSVSLSAIYASPLSRSVQTAQSIAQFQQTDVCTLDKLTEIDLGIVDGLSSFVAYEQYRTLMDDALDESLADFCFPRGESRSAALVRFQSSVDQIICNHPEGTVCIVTHGGPLGLWLSHLHGEPLGRFRAWQPTHGSITRVVNVSDQYHIVTRDETDHLPTELHVSLTRL